MKKILTAIAVAAIPAAALAQSAISAYQLSTSDMRGTARFMSMAGAFGALGGDLSTLNQNPAGIGVYRSSEIGATVDFDFASTAMTGVTTNNNHVYFNNIGYIGASRTGNSVMPYMQWGFSYSRLASLDRTFSGGINSLGNSMSNYVANYTNSLGYSPEDLLATNSYNPYYDSGCDWLSILSYDGYLINQVGKTGKYNGLFVENQTTGNSQFDVRQRGYVDEYSINIGGNILNTVYWGIGFGINDIGFSEESYYDEELFDARISKDKNGTGMTDGQAYFNLGNWRRVDGTGFNIKVGAIVKPINELRLGIAVHTPTYYSLTEKYNGNVAFKYSSAAGDGTSYTGDALFDWKLRSPWKLLVSAAGVVGGRFIVSGDYEMKAYDNMCVSNGAGTEYGAITDDIKYCFRPESTIRLGLEYRLTPKFSVRGGFAQSFSALKEGVNEGEEEIFTSGTNPAYSFDTGTRYLTLGIGYRTGGFYLDAAYVNKYRNSTWHAYTPYDDGAGWIYEPFADYNTSENNIVLSMGFKF